MRGKTILLLVLSEGKPFNAQFGSLSCKDGEVIGGG
jgi:hypothetical protein